MASAPKLILTDRPSDAAHEVIDGGLAQYNEEQAGYGDWRDLAVLATDPDDEVRGGLLGRASLGLFFVDLFYLPPEMRRLGIGSRVFAVAEEEAVRRGCVSGVLFTISFQAPGFYARHGWREVARIRCLPTGTSRIVMTKNLTP
jgi:GNAT superfamily N-acetyltransferase